MNRLEARGGGGVARGLGRLAIRSTLGPALALALAVPSLLSPAAFAEKPGAARNGELFSNPTRFVQKRVQELQSSIPKNTKGRITMAVAVVEDPKQHDRSVLIGTSEPRGYLRPGVTIRKGEELVGGLGHAEADLVAHAKMKRLKVIEIGATRPVCTDCQKTIEPSGANIATPVKKKAKSRGSP